MTPRIRKYKAWDTRLNKWSTDFVGLAHTGDYMFRYLGDIINFEPSRSRCKVVEFTGKLDIDGKEVYEGDILDFANGDPQTYEVRWDEEEGAWGVFMLNPDINAFKISMVNLMKIVGNRYEQE